MFAKQISYCSRISVWHRSNEGKKANTKWEKKSQICIFLRITSTMKFKTMVHLKQDHSLAPSLSISKFLYLAPCLCLLDLSSNGVVNSSFQFLITFFATSLLPFENRHMCAHECILRNSPLLN